MGRVVAVLDAAGLWSTGLATLRRSSTCTSCKEWPSLPDVVASGNVVVHVPDAGDDFVRSQVALREGARLGAAVSSVLEVNVVSDLICTSWALHGSCRSLFPASILDSLDHEEMRLAKSIDDVAHVLGLISGYRIELDCTGKDFARDVWMPAVEGVEG